MRLAARSATARKGSSFSGLTFSGGFSGERFTRSSIDRLAGVKVPNISVEQADFETSS
jgi:DNA adenine methylase